MLTTFLLTLLALAPPASSSAPAPAPLVQDKAAKPSDPLDAEFAKLQNEAQEAYYAWAEKKKTDPKAPAWELGMWDKFQALADKGSGRAQLWLATKAQVKTDSKKEATTKKLELFGALIQKHASAEWGEDIVSAIQAQKKWFGMSEMDKLLCQLKSTSTNREVQAAALQALSKVLDGTSASESDKKRGTEYKAELVKDYQGTRVVDRLNAKEFHDTNLVVGKPVPDFTAKDVEGVEFKLSDYKGKVVLLDFWGFW